MSRGGARAGAGRPLKSGDTARGKLVRIAITQTEHEVLELLSQQWGVPVATAAYGLLADSLAKCRKAKPLAIPRNMILAASQIIARHERASGG